MSEADVERDSLKPKLSAAEILRREKISAAMIERNRDDLLAEYRAAGIAPVYAGDGATVVSLAMMLHLGWRIEKVDGNHSLTRWPGT